ncbi:MAG TPA: NTP transferase domain-containing protein [Propionibacteriaceae bacterium]|jgi:molybdopterin-guanine dinucleotide biosynthesis protein A/uridine kinase
MNGHGSRAAVVLAGGASRRFGSDKLDAAVEGRSLLDRAIEGLPDDVRVIVVGPERPLLRTAHFVREDPPGGGPAAGMVAGLRTALTSEPDQVLVLPGDAPYAGHAALLLLSVLVESAGATAVVGTDASGFEQPLQLALSRSAAEDLVRAAGPDGAHGGSARALVNRLQPPARRQQLPSEAHWDVDTPAQLLAWEQRDSPAVQAIVAAVGGLELARRPRPVLVALDGRSGAGKTTLAAALALCRPATVISGDDFYSPGMAVLDVRARERLTDAEIAEQVFDWRRLRDQALVPLVHGQWARYAPYDWTAQDGRLGKRVELPPSSLVILEGVYSGRPELADLMDLAVLVEIPAERRRQRLSERVNDPADWVAVWERGEDHYFGRVRLPDSYDLTVQPLRG